MSGYSHSLSQIQSPPSQDTLINAGLDPALAQAMLLRNPSALAAAAGILDNSLIAAAIGRPQACDERRSDGDETQEEERGSVWAQGLADDREMDDHPQEGSGEHGRLEPTMADQANHAFWRGVAVSAEGMGLVNAARHMHHFLDNSGQTLDLDLDIVETTCPVFAQNIAEAQSAVIAESLDLLDVADTTLSGGWTCDEMVFKGAESNFSKDITEDWFYAVGGNTHIMTTSCRYEPDSDGSGHGTLYFSTSWELTDRYNWDEGKSVTIMGVTVNDEVLGRLHVVGIAQEYDIQGMRADTFTSRFTGQSAGPETVADPEEDSGREQRTGRDDTDRERQ